MFGDVNKAITKLGNRFSPKQWIIAGGVLLAVVIILALVPQCADDEEGAGAAASEAASVERQVLSGAQPNLYLVKPGVVEVDK